MRSLDHSTESIFPGGEFPGQVTSVPTVAMSVILREVPIRERMNPDKGYR